MIETAFGPASLTEDTYLGFGLYHNPREHRIEARHATRGVVAWLDERLAQDRSAALSWWHRLWQAHARLLRFDGLETEAAPTIAADGVPPTQRALLRCAEAMVFLMSIGWSKTALPRLMGLWWTVRDHNGNVI